MKILFKISAIITILLIVGCVDKPISYRFKVEPLSRLAFKQKPRELFSIFKSYETVPYANPSITKEWIARHYRYPDSVIDVDIQLQNNLNAAREMFQSHCASSDVFTSGGSDDDRYCIYYVKTTRADPEGLWAFLGYNSFVVFQKQDMIITIRENTSKKGKFRTDEVIREIAELLSQE